MEMPQRNGRQLVIGERHVYAIKNKSCVQWEWRVKKKKSFFFFSFENLERSI
jgi:hypothetical protein